MSFRKVTKGFGNFLDVTPLKQNLSEQPDDLTLHIRL